MLEGCRSRQCCREPAVLADSTIKKEKKMFNKRRKRHYCRKPAVLHDAIKEKKIYWKNSLRCSGYGAR